MFLKSTVRPWEDVYKRQDMNDFHECVKMLTVETIETTLDAEFENDFGYSKYTYKNK